MATRLTSQILQILRAESGYKLETSGVASMDEQFFADTSPDLVALGLEIVRRHKLPQPTCLGDVLGEPSMNASDATTFAYTMLSWAMRPMADGMFLLLPCKPKGMPGCKCLPLLLMSSCFSLQWLITSLQLANIPRLEKSFVIRGITQKYSLVRRFLSYNCEELTFYRCLPKILT